MNLIMMRSRRGIQEEARAFFEEAVIQDYAGRKEKAKKLYQVSIRLHPLPGALVNLGTIFFEDQEWFSAEECYREAVIIDPLYSIAYFNLGNVLDELRNFDEAEFHYWYALQLNPDYADAHYNIAFLYEKRGRLMESMHHWRQYIRLDATGIWHNFAKKALNGIKSRLVVQSPPTMR